MMDVETDVSAVVTVEDKWNRESYLSALDKLSSSSSPKQALNQLLDTITNYFPSFDLIIPLIDQALTFNEDEVLTSDELRQVFEQAIRVCGSDIFTGIEVWKKYIDFEVDEHDDLLEQGEAIATLDAVKRSKERFIKLFHRALSLPLVGNEEVLTLFDKLLGEYCSEADVEMIRPDLLSKRYQESTSFREARLVFEMHLHSEKYTNSTDSEKIASWKAYIKFENDEKQLSRVQRLYERAMLACGSLSSDLWVEYCIFSLTVLKNMSLSVFVTERALHFFPYLPWISKLRLISLQGDCVNSDHRSSIISSYQQSIAQGFYDAQDYLDYMLVYCNCWRRLLENSLLKSSSSFIEQDSQYLQAGLQEIETFLTTYYDTWTAGWWRFTKYHAEQSHNLLKRAQLFISSGSTSNSLHTLDANKEADGNKKVKKIKSWDTFTAKFPQSYWSWQEAVTWFASKGEFESCRACYRKILHMHLDVSAQDIALDWFRFEDDFGEVTSLTYAIGRIASIVNMASTSTTATASSGGNNTEPVVADAPASKSTLANESSSQLKADNHNNNSNKHSMDNKKAKKRPLELATTEDTNPKKSKVHESAPINAPTKAFSKSILVRNLPFNATESEMTSFFKALVPIEHITCLQTKAGKFRGMVRIDVASEDIFNQLIHKNEVDFHDRKLHILDYEGSPEAIQESKLKEVNLMEKGVMAAANTNTVFVNHLNPEVTDADLMSFFGSCGHIVGARVALDKKTGQSKGTALVQFATEDERNNALKLHKQQWKGGAITVQTSRFALLPSYVASAAEGTTSSNTNSNHQSTKDAETISNIQATLNTEEKASSEHLPPVESSPAVTEKVNPYLAHQQDTAGKEDSKKKPSGFSTMFKPRGLAKPKK